MIRHRSSRNKNIVVLPKADLEGKESERYTIALLVLVLLGIIVFVMREHFFDFPPQNSSRSGTVLTSHKQTENSKEGIMREYKSMRVLMPWDNASQHVDSPFVMRGAVRGWQEHGAWSMAYFEQRFGASSAVAMRNPFPTVRIDGSGQDMFTIPLVHLIAEARASKGSGKVPIYGVITLDLVERQEIWGNLELPRVLRDDLFLACLGRQDPQGELVEDFMDGFFWSQIFVGAEGSGMQMHRDSLRSHVWSAQLHGEKQLVACRGPDNRDARKRATWQSKFGDSALVDVFHSINHDKFPDFSSAECVWAAAQPGDLLFWPSNWYHQTLNANGTSIAMSGMALDGLISSEFLRGLSRHPRGTKSLQVAVKKCFIELGLRVV